VKVTSSAPLVLNRINPSLIAIGGLTDVYTTQDSLSEHAHSIDFTLTDLGSTDGPSVIIYGTVNDRLAIAVGAWLGTRLLIAAPAEPFLLVLAFVMLLYLNLDRLGRGHSEMVQRQRAVFGIAFGFAAGVFEAIANVAGPVLLIYFMLIGLAPSQIVQALNLCFSVGKSSQVLTLAASGALSAASWLVVAALSVPSVAALFVGMRLRERIDAATYRSLLRKALGIMAVLLIGQFFISSS